MTVPVTPPSNSVFPVGDADLSVWALNFASVWIPANFLAVVPSSGDLIAAAELFESRLAARISDPSPSNVGLKNAARVALIALIRPAARSAFSYYRSTPSIGPGLTALGLRLPDLVPTTIFPPVDAPLLSVGSVSPGVGLLRVTQVVLGVPVNTRAFPVGVANLLVERKVVGGEWVFDQSVRRVNVDVDMSAFAIGAVVQYRCAYVNPRGQHGPFSPAISLVTL